MVSTCFAKTLSVEIVSGFVQVPLTKVIKCYHQPNLNWDDSCSWVVVTQKETVEKGRISAIMQLHLQSGSISSCSVVNAALKTCRGDSWSIPASVKCRGLRERTHTICIDESLQTNANANLSRWRLPTHIIHVCAQTQSPRKGFVLYTLLMARAKHGNYTPDNLLPNSLRKHFHMKL